MIYIGIVTVAILLSLLMGIDACCQVVRASRRRFYR